MKYFYVYFLIFVLFFTGCAVNSEPQITSNTNNENKQKQESLKTKANEEKKSEIAKTEVETGEKKAEPKVIIKEKTKIVVVEKPISEDSKIIAGSAEYVYIPFLKLTYKAKIDTGATTTSLHALDIKEFERDGKKWVKFKIESRGKQVEKSLPVERMVSIKRHAAQSQKRYVVKLRINLGTASEVVDVSLTDRSKFEFPLLIGRNFLNGYVIVDVSKSYLTTPKKD